MNFKKFKHLFDYRKYLTYNYLEQFEDLFIVNSETNRYFYNRLFLGRCWILHSKTRLKTKDIDKVMVGESSFLIFCLSKPIIKFSNIELKEYSDLFQDITDQARLPKWMEMDKLYKFEFNVLKKDVKNKMIPYSSIVELKDMFKVDFIDSKHKAVRVSVGRLPQKERRKFSKKELKKMDADSPCLVFFFENMIECYKFYSYCKALIKNQSEFYNSLKYKIHYNLGRRN